MPITIEVIGLKKIQQRMRAFPQAYNTQVKKTLKWSLLKIWGNVPSYPVYESSYIRKGSAGLGGSLGSDIGGGKQQGPPDIYQMFEQGGNIDGAEFGTKIEYAPYVIGERQAGHMGHWWTMKGLAKKTKPHIISAFKKMGVELARFLDGKGLL